MGTITISAAGFAATPAGTPANWPVGVTYPGVATPNGSKAYTVSDADMLRLLTWIATTQLTGGSSSAPLTPTMGQILLAYAGLLRNGTVQAIQTNEVVPAVIGTPITMT